MDNPEQPREANDPLGIIASAEQLVAELWKDEAGEEEKAKIAPPGSEALEDEIAALRIAVDAHLVDIAKENDVTDMNIHCRILDVDRFTGADVPLWGVGVCVEGHCGDPGCKRGLHHAQKRFIVSRRRDGSYVVMEYEEIMNVRNKEENKACMHPRIAGAIQLNLGDILEDVVKQKIAEQMRGDDEDEEELPPAATTSASRPSEETLRQLKAFLENSPSDEEDPEPCETTAVLPKIDIDAYHHGMRRNNEDKARPGLLRLAWNWLWR